MYKTKIFTFIVICLLSLVGSITLIASAQAGLSVLPDAVIAFTPLAHISNGALIEETPYSYITSATLTPALGKTTTSFTWSVRFYSSISTAPMISNVVIDDIPHAMSLSSGQAYNGIYQWSQYLTDTGIHAYRYEFTDSLGNSRILPVSGNYTGPQVYADAQLTSPVLAPVYAIPSTSFSWQVQYIDPNGFAPASKNIIIDSNSYAMNLIAGSASNGTYGFTTIYNQGGVHNYRYSFKDSINSGILLPVSGNYSGPTVNTSPALSGGYVAPGLGSPSTQFTFVANFQDPDNHYPASAQLILDGTPASMTLFTGSATNATYVRYTTLPVGVHSFYYQFTDPYGASARFPDAGTISGPTVNNSPILSNALINPTYGIPSSSFTWSVNYLDNDGNAPASNQVYIDGNAYDLSLTSGVAANGTYQVTRSLNTPGVHQYYFVASDGLGSSVRYPVSGTFSGPTVNTNPTMSNGYVSPGFGVYSSLFNFVVGYQDIDNHYAKNVQMVIDGNTIPMSLFSGPATNATYVITTGFSAGIHSYYYQCTDPYGATARFPSSGTLSGPTIYQLNPPGGLTATVSSLSVVNLNWQDNSIQETGTRIEYRIDTSSWQTLVTVNAEVTTYTYNVAPYKSYSYRAYAMANYARSADSNEVTINPGLWINAMGDFDQSSDTTNFSVQLLAGIPSYPAISWLNSYSGHSGIMQLNFSNLPQGVKITGIGRVRADSAANPWHRIRVTYYADASTNGLEVLPSILFYDSYTSYNIREIGAVWSGVGLQSTRNWYTLEGYVYSHSTSGFLQITFKNSGAQGSIYVDTIEWDYAVPPALLHPLSVPVAKGDFDVATDSSGWAYQQMADCSPVLPTIGWSTGKAGQAGVLSLSYSQITQGTKITLIDLLTAPKGKNVTMGFKVYLANTSPTAMHINAYLMGEQSLALSQFDFAGYAELGILPGNTWTTLYLPFTSSSLQTNYRIQFQIKDNFTAPITLYVDDVQFMYDQNSEQTPLELVEQTVNSIPFHYIS